MPKVISAHVGEYKKPQSLLQQIDEAGFLDRVKKAVGLGKDAETAEPEAEPERARPDGEVEDNSALETLAGEMMNPGPGETRLVLYVPRAWLTSYYLVSGGGAKLVDQLDDADITEIATDSPQGEAKNGKSYLVELTPNFSYSSMLAPPSSQSKADRAILINAPKKMVTDLRAAGSDVAKGREALKKLMSHKIYVMTLNLPKASTSKIVASMGTARNTNEIAASLDPAIIENYPVSTRLKDAKREWEEKLEAIPKKPSKDEKEETEVQRAEREANLIARRRAADAVKAGPSSDVNAEIITRIGRAENAFKAADQLVGWAKTQGIDKVALLSRLDDLKTRHPLVNIPGVIERLEKLKL